MAGNHRSFKAKTNIRTKAVKKTGEATKISVMTDIDPGIHLYRTDNAHGDGDENGQHAAEQHQGHGGADALPDQEANALFILVALAQIALENASDPDDVLLRGGFIQVIMLPKLLFRLFTDALALGHGSHRVRGRDADQGKNNDRDRKQDQDHLSQPFENKFSHRNASFALQ